MASPVDAERVATNISTAADPWTVNLFTTITAGELLLMFCRISVFNILTAPSGWTSLVDAAADSSDDATRIFYRWADGSEGTTVSVDPNGSAKGAAITYRITGAANPATQAPENATPNGTNGSTTLTTSPITPTGGSKDYLFIVAGGIDGETQSFTVLTNYANLVQGNSGTGGAAATNVRIASCSRQLTTDTHDPPDYTISAAPSNGGTTVTLAIHPSAPAAPGPSALMPKMSARALARRRL